MIDEASALEDKSALENAFRERKIEQYILKHGKPVCGCGCGGFTKFDQRGNPRKYILHHSHRNRLEKYKDDPNWISTDQFLGVLEKLGEKKGLTWAEMARRCSKNRGYFANLRKQTYIHKTVATELLRRISGIGMIPNKEEAKKLKQGEIVTLPGKQTYFRYENHML